MCCGEVESVESVEIGEGYEEECNELIVGCFVFCVLMRWGVRVKWNFRWELKG